MGILGKALRGLGVIAVAAFTLAGFQAPAASAATGTVLADLTPTGLPGGVSVAFDGQYLYYTDLGGAVLHRMAPNGTPGTDVPILGGVAINALTYDASHDVFWGVDATGLNVYRIEKDGWAGLQFTIIPALDLPGLCNSLSGCSPTVSGLGYDATTDTLWYLPQGSQRVYHFDTSGQPQGYFDVRNVPDCATNAATGIAAGAGVLYLTAGGCGRGFQYAKSDSGAGTKLSSFSAGGPQSAGAACDNVSFSSITALWTRDASTGHLRAIEVPAGTCVAGGGVSFAGTGMWMAGSGQSQGTGALPLGTGPFAVPKIQIAYHLLCDPSAGAQPSNPGGPPNNMVINWSAPDAADPTATDHFSFHLQQLVLNKCQFTATQAPFGFRNPPCQPASNNTCFNTMQGTGLGSLRGRGPNGQVILGGTNCDKCGQVDFYFQDAGEPNTYDIISFQVTDVSSIAGVLANCPEFDCSRANNQAHQQSQ